MPSRPPKVKVGIGKPAGKPKSWAHSMERKTTARGYGWAHQQMRIIVLREEPLCRPCLAVNRVTASTTADHITPLAEGGTGDRLNMQGICNDCHKAKTAKESARASAASRQR
ncbi:hypothetical protein SPH9361_03402 [Sphingobium sp. CECT 9361]|nr:hypothetical protein SPH9361_03402 [Sphingobium sp. CECT 9361]